MLLIVFLSAAFIKSPFCGFVNHFQYMMYWGLVPVAVECSLADDTVADAGSLSS